MVCCEVTRTTRWGTSNSARRRAQRPDEGNRDLDKALELKADFPAARAVRGSLYYTQGKPEAALPDLEAVASETQDSAVLDRLGQTYLALDRLPDAVRVLRKPPRCPVIQRCCCIWPMRWPSPEQDGGI